MVRAGSSGGQADSLFDAAGEEAARAAAPLAVRMRPRTLDEVIGLSHEEAQSQFGFLLDAFKFGPPPHGGIAFGWDRLIMLLAGRDTIREVIAFPKAASGLDPLTGAPTPITPEQRKEAGIDAPARAQGGTTGGQPG